MLRFERHLAHDVERVWRAVTEPAELAAWFPGRVEIEASVGGRIVFSEAGMDIDPDLLPTGGVVTDLDPPGCSGSSGAGTVYVSSWPPRTGGARSSSPTASRTAPARPRVSTGWWVCSEPASRPRLWRGGPCSTATATCSGGRGRSPAETTAPWRCCVSNGSSTSCAGGVGGAHRSRTPPSMAGRGDHRPTGRRARGAALRHPGRLLLTHTVHGHGDAAGTLAAWDVHLTVLASGLDGRPDARFPQAPFPEERWAARREQYRDVVR